MQQNKRLHLVMQQCNKFNDYPVIYARKNWVNNVLNSLNVKVFILWILDGYSQCFLLNGDREN